MDSASFDFIKENGVYIWRNGGISLEYSEPMITPHSNTPLRRPEDILYYYYNMEVKVSSYNVEKQDYEWVHVTGVTTHDFPAIRGFADCLNAIIYDYNRFDESWEVYSCGDEDDDDVEKTYVKTIELRHLLAEDCYEIKKYMNPHSCTTFYRIFMGTAAGGASMGVYTYELTENDIRALLKCVESFIRYSIECYNEHNKVSSDFYTSLFRPVNGKLYEYYAEPWESLTCDFRSVGAIYQAGDVLQEIYVLVTEDDGVCWEKKLHYKTIEEVTEKEVRFTDGTSARFGEITDIWHDYDNLVSLSAEEIKEDFENRLGEAERKDFTELSEEELYEKYSEAILDRSAMCRDEHNLPLIVAEGQHPRINANAHIRRIIAAIKKSLLQCQ